MVTHVAVVIIIGTLLTPRINGQNLHIVHDGQTLGRFGPVDFDGRVCYQGEGYCFGGVARIVTTIRAINQTLHEDDVLLYLYTGAFCGGTALFAMKTTAEKAEMCADFLNVLKPDAMAVTHIELAEGAELLKIIHEKTQIPLLTSIHWSAGEGVLKEYVILEKKKWTIGILGFLYFEKRLRLPEFYDSYTPRFEAYLKDVLPEIKEKRADFVIALGYSSFLEDKKAASEVSGIHFMITGGSYYSFVSNKKGADGRIPTDEYPVMVKHNATSKIYLTHSVGRAMYLGHLVCKIQSDNHIVDCSGDQIFMNSSIQEDKQTKDLFEKYLSSVKALQTQIIGKNHIPLNGRMCRQLECNFGNVITDAFVAYAAELYSSKENYWSNISIGLISSSFIMGSIRTNGAKEISMFELHDAFHSGGNLTVMSISGRDLKDTLEFGLYEIIGNNRAEFLQVSGVQFEYDGSEPRDYKISRVKVCCASCAVVGYEEIKNDKRYSVITNSQMSHGSGGHRALRYSLLKRYTLDIDDISCIVWYLGGTHNILTGVENRIHEIYIKKSSDKANRLENSIVLMVGAVISVNKILQL